MKRDLAALFVLTFLVSLTYAEWTETLKVMVLDQNSYPVANVPVTIKYQKNTFLSIEVVPEIETKAVGSGTSSIDCSVLPEGEKCPSLEEYGVNEAVVPVVDVD